MLIFNCAEKDCQEDALPKRMFCAKHAGLDNDGDRKLTKDFWAGLVVGILFSALVFLVGFLIWTT